MWRPLFCGALLLHFWEPAGLAGLVVHSTALDQTKVAVLSEEGKPLPNNPSIENNLNEVFSKIDGGGGRLSKEEVVGACRGREGVCGGWG